MVDFAKDVVVDQEDLCGAQEPGDYCSILQYTGDSAPLVIALYPLNLHSM